MIEVKIKKCPFHDNEFGMPKPTDSEDVDLITNSSVSNFGDEYSDKLLSFPDIDMVSKDENLAVIIAPLIQSPGNSSEMFAIHSYMQMSYWASNKIVGAIHKIGVVEMQHYDHYMELFNALGGSPSMLPYSALSLENNSAYKDDKSIINTLIDGETLTIEQIDCVINYINVYLDVSNKYNSVNNTNICIKLLKKVRADEVKHLNKLQMLLNTQ